MSLQKFDPSTAADEESLAAYHGLREFFEKQREQRAFDRVFNAGTVFDMAGAIAPHKLARVLARLVNEGLLQQIVRVEPEFGSGIGDFNNVAEVPATLEDWRHPGNVVEVLPGHLQVYYRLAAEA